MADLVAFLGASIVVIVTPGQDTALTVRNTILGGQRTGACTALGVAAGQAAWTLATSLGLTAILIESEHAFIALKLAGAAYLIFLGGKSLAVAVRSSRADDRDAGEKDSGRLSPSAGLRQGVLSNLGNPKMAVFFTSLLPQFTPEGSATFGVLLSLGLVFCALTLVWLTAYSIVVARTGDLLRRPRIRRTLESSTGLFLVALGVLLSLNIASER